jgi:two-component system chemotaxis response regulator CheB
LSTSRRVRVLVVDDSAFARKVLRLILSRRPEIEVVGVAYDGLDALEQIAELAPDVITLDLVMPHLDGLGVLAGLPQEGAPRVVLVSSSGDDSAAVVAGLQLGAIASVRKPTASATDRLYEMSEPLVEAVLRAAEARASALAPVAATPVPVARLPTRTALLVVGASTGGPQAISRLLTSLPESFPVPIAIVLHMPVGYTDAFARRLDEMCALRVVEAADRMALRPGTAIIGRAGLHLSIESSSSVRLVASPTEGPHRPSVDVLFRSAAAALGSQVLGVVLTGMGDDGLAGSRAIVAAGGQVMSQSKASCVVYGMPRCVAEAGLSVEVADIEQMAERIVRRL